jgi:hypothetical protein
VKLLSKRLILSILLLIVVATVALLLLVRSKIGSLREPTIPAVALESKREYHMGIAGEYAGADRHHKAAFSDVWADDGRSFYRRSDYFDSADRAHVEMEKTLKRATTILRREPLFDDAGHNIGEKVIATFPFNDGYNGPASLLFTEGSTFAYIQGPSLQSILQYERDVFR